MARSGSRYGAATASPPVAAPRWRNRTGRRRGECSTGQRRPGVGRPDTCGRVASARARQLEINTGKASRAGAITPSTWRSFGGSQFASSANRAKPRGQCRRGKGARRAGWGAWPGVLPQAGCPGSSATQRTVTAGRRPRRGGRHRRAAGKAQQSPRTPRSEIPAPRRPRTPVVPACNAVPAAPPRSRRCWRRHPAGPAPTPALPRCPASATAAGQHLRISTAPSARRGWAAGGRATRRRISPLRRPSSARHHAHTGTSLLGPSHARTYLVRPAHPSGIAQGAAAGWELYQRTGARSTTPT